MKSGQVTIIDIARKLGLSKSTVSRALRNHPHVKEATRIAVKSLAEKWDYQPDTIAQSMINRKTLTLGIVIPNVSFPYFSHTLNGVQEIASKAGYNLMICQSNESFEREKSVIQTLVSSRVDGLLLSISKETKTFDHIEALQKKGIPLVLFDRIAEPLTLPKVYINNVDASFQATEHLIKEGYQRIAHIAGPESLWVSHQRIKGYLDAHKAYGVNADPELIIFKGFRMEDGKCAAAKLMENASPPDAILAVSDSAAIGAKMELESQGFKIPEDVAIVGFNNEIIASIVQPGLTSVAIPMDNLGRTAAQMLLRQITYPHEVSGSEQKVLHAKLVIRASSLRQK